MPEQFPLGTSIPETANSGSTYLSQGKLSPPKDAGNEFLNEVTLSSLITYCNQPLIDQHNKYCDEIIASSETFVKVQAVATRSVDVEPIDVAVLTKPQDSHKFKDTEPTLKKAIAFLYATGLVNKEKAEDRNYFAETLSMHNNLFFTVHFCAEVQDVLQNNILVAISICLLSDLENSIVTASHIEVDAQGNTTATTMPIDFFSSCTNCEDDFPITLLFSKAPDLELVGLQPNVYSIVSLEELAEFYGFEIKVIDEYKHYIEYISQSLTVKELTMTFYYALGLAMLHPKVITSSATKVLSKFTDIDWEKINS